MQSDSDLLERMHLSREKNDTYALGPKEKHMGQTPQAYGSSPKSAQAYGSQSEPQAYGSILSLEVKNIISKHAFWDESTGWRKTVFKLCRELRSIVRENENPWNLETWKAITAYWLEVAQTNCMKERPRFDTALSQFKKKLAIDVKKSLSERPWIKSRL